MEDIESVYISMRLVAPAGNSKSAVIVGKYLHLLRLGISHKGILVMTFTNKAAEELRERISAAAGIDSKQLEIYTYNSFCYSIVKRYKKVLGLDKIKLIKKSERYNFILEYLNKSPLEGVSYINPFSKTYGIVPEIIEYWTIECMTLDDSTRPQKEILSFNTYEEAKAVKKGYIGQH